MSNWFVLQVFSGQEKKVKKSLDEMKERAGVAEEIEEVLLPTENVSEVVKGEQRVVEKKVWPGYLLIKMLMTDESWQYVKGTSGVIDFLGGAAPTSLTDVEVDKILSELKEKKGRITRKQQFQIGDSVKIVEGVFENFVGTVTDVFDEKGKVNVIVSIFDRDTPVDNLDFSQVEQVSEDELQ